MHTLQSDRLKSSRTDTVAENTEHTQRQPRVVGTSDGIALAAEPSYDREYDQLLTLEEAVDQ